MLNIIKEQNPNLVIAATELHRNGNIPSDCYVVDLDVVESNAREIYECAARLGLRTYVMTKQINRNPSLIKTIVKSGFEAFVAVDIECAYLLNKQNCTVGHVGHLSQIPRNRMKETLKMKPEIWTVHHKEHARFISEAANDLNVKQDIILKVIDKDDMAYPAQEGGILIEDVLKTADFISSLDNLNVVGVTGFPCALYDFEERTINASSNLHTIIKAAELLDSKLGIDIKHINAPGSSSCESMEVIASYGATDAEPGSAIWGMAMQQIYGTDVGTPAQVYVTEVSHWAGKTAQVLGGGFYADGAGHEMMSIKKAFVGDRSDTILDNEVDAEAPIPQWMDYYAWLYPTNSKKVKPGDTAVYFFRPQVFMTRSAHIATVSGIKSGNIQVQAIYDRSNNLIQL